MNNKIQFDFDDLPKAYFCDNKKSDELRKQVIKNITFSGECNTPQLSDVFFSDENMDLINKQLIYSVWKHTNGEYKIAKQSKDNLMIVMRYFFIEYARHLPYDIKGQISELNCLVVSNILPNVISNAEQYIGYLRDIGPRQEPVPLPVSTSNRNRDLPSITTILNS
jgi:hypothetical protein